MPRSLAGNDTIVLGVATIQSRDTVCVFLKATVRVNRPRATRQLANQSEGYAGTVRLGHLDPGGLICRDVLRTTRAFSNCLVLSELIGSQKLSGSTAVYVGQSGQKGPVSHSRQPDRQADRRQGLQSFPLCRLATKSSEADVWRAWAGQDRGQSRCRGFT